MSTQLNENECILKILDIEANQVDYRVVKHGIWNRVAGFEKYRDKSQIHEDIYGCEILAEMKDAGIEVEKEVSDLLEEIQLLCDKYECPYWRIINVVYENK
jgi:hypothetical protein